MYFMLLWFIQNFGFLLVTPTLYGSVAASYTISNMKKHRENSYNQLNFRFANQKTTEKNCTVTAIQQTINWTQLTNKGGA